MIQKDIGNWFGSRFIRGYARNIISNWEIALVELIANSYDAGAKKVFINIENGGRKSLEVKDDGIGMTKDEFLFRWKGIGYDRRKQQGKEVYYPNGEKSNRIAYGKNGKGRFAMYCFSNSYFVEIWKNGNYNKFKVKKGQVVPFDIEHLKTKKVDITKTGLKITTNIENILVLDERVIINVIGSRFFSDPSFKIFVNQKQITEEDIGDRISEETINTPFGDITVKFIKTKRGRTTQQNGIAWWVNYRLVGNLSWELSDGEKLDRRYREARLYVFIIIANFLNDEVNDDWTGFEKTERYSEVFNIVSDYLTEKLDNLFQNHREERKKKALHPKFKQLKDLDVRSRDFIGKFTSEVLIKCPSIKDIDFENILEILIKLEESEIKYELFGSLAKLETAELEDLNEIISKWSVRDAKIILTEIYRRIDLINKLEEFTEKKSDELHRLQPIFEKALWIFGPEYDTIQFTSNETLHKVIKKFFDKKFPKKVLIRPDFVIVPDSFSIGIYASDDYNNEGDPEGIGKVLILELKKGDSTLNLEEMQQAEKYCLYLLEEGHLSRTTVINCLVLGTRMGKYAKKKTTGDNDNVVIKPLTFINVIKIAKARLLNLKDKIEENKNLKDDDSIIADILKQETINQ